MERSKEQVAALTRRLEKSRSQNAKLVEQVKESVMNSNDHIKAEDNEMRDAELGELRKVGGFVGAEIMHLSVAMESPRDCRMVVR